MKKDARAPIVNANFQMTIRPLKLLASFSQAGNITFELRNDHRSESLGSCYPVESSTQILKLKDCFSTTFNAFLDAEKKTLESKSIELKIILKEREKEHAYGMICFPVSSLINSEREKIIEEFPVEQCLCFDARLLVQIDIVCTGHEKRPFKPPAIVLEELNQLISSVQGKKKEMANSPPRRNNHFLENSRLGTHSQPTHQLSKSPRQLTRKVLHQTSTLLQSALVNSRDSPFKKMKKTKSFHDKEPTIIVERQRPHHRTVLKAILLIKEKTIMPTLSYPIDTVSALESSQCKVEETSGRNSPSSKKFYLLKPSKSDIILTEEFQSLPIKMSQQNLKKAVLQPSSSQKIISKVVRNKKTSSHIAPSILCKTVSGASQTNWISSPKKIGKSKTKSFEEKNKSPKEGSAFSVPNELLRFCVKAVEVEVVTGKKGYLNKCGSSSENSNTVDDISNQIEGNIEKESLTSKTIQQNSLELKSDEKNSLGINEDNSSAQSVSSSSYTSSKPENNIPQISEIDCQKKYNQESKINFSYHFKKVFASSPSSKKENIQASLLFSNSGYSEYDPDVHLQELYSFCLANLEEEIKDKSQSKKPYFPNEDIQIENESKSLEAMNTKKSLNKKPLLNEEKEVIIKGEEPLLKMQNEWVSFPDNLSTSLSPVLILNVQVSSNKSRDVFKKEMEVESKFSELVSAHATEGREEILIKAESCSPALVKRKTLPESFLIGLNSTPADNMKEKRKSAREFETFGKKVLTVARSISNEEGEWSNNLTQLNGSENVAENLNEQKNTKKSSAVSKSCLSICSPTTPLESYEKSQHLQNRDSDFIPSRQKNIFEQSSPKQETSLDSRPVYQLISQEPSFATEKAKMFRNSLKSDSFNSNEENSLYLIVNDAPISKQDKTEKILNFHENAENNKNLDGASLEISDIPVSEVEGLEKNSNENEDKLLKRDNHNKTLTKNIDYEEKNDVRTGEINNSRSFSKSSSKFSQKTLNIKQKNDNLEADVEYPLNTIFLNTDQAVSSPPNIENVFFPLIDLPSEFSPKENLSSPLCLDSRDSEKMKSVKPKATESFPHADTSDEKSSNLTKIDRFAVLKMPVENKNLLQKTSSISSAVEVISKDLSSSVLNPETSTACKEIQLPRQIVCVGPLLVHTASESNACLLSKVSKSSKNPLKAEKDRNSSSKHTLLSLISSREGHSISQSSCTSRAPTKVRRRLYLCYSYAQEKDFERVEADAGLCQLTDSLQAVPLVEDTPIKRASLRIIKTVCFEQKTHRRAHELASFPLLRFCSKKAVSVGFGFNTSPLQLLNRPSTRPPKHIEVHHVGGIFQREGCGLRNERGIASFQLFSAESPSADRQSPVVRRKSRMRLTEELLERTHEARFVGRLAEKLREEAELAKTERTRLALELQALQRLHEKAINSIADLRQRVTDGEVALFKAQSAAASIREWATRCLPLDSVAELSRIFDSFK